MTDSTKTVGEALGRIFAAATLGVVPTIICWWAFAAPGWALFALWSLTTDLALVRMRLP